MSRRDVLPTSLPPRGLSRVEAAAYVGVSPSTFDAWVARALMPASIPGTKRWDRKAIDAALDKVSGLKNDPSASALDEWLEGQGGHARAS